MSGIHKREGWTTLDSDRDHGPDILASIPPLPEAVTSRKWDEIEWVHGITSLYPWEAAALLPQLRSALARGGKLVLEQPDAQKAIAAAAGNIDRLGWLFGDPSIGKAAHMNKWAYTPDTLAEALRLAGFRRADTLPAQHHNVERDFRMEAWA